FAKYDRSSFLFFLLSLPLPFVLTGGQRDNFSFSACLLVSRCVSRGSEMPKGVDPKQFSFRATGRFTPRQTGDYTFGMVNAGPARFSLDGRVVIDQWSQPTVGADFLGAPETQETLTLEAGRSYLLTLEYA